MPDAARLVAAICLAIIAFVLSGFVMEAWNAERGVTNFGWFVYVNVVVGIVVGWTAMGKRAGRGVSAAITNGVTGVFLLVLWGVFIQACNEMVRLAMKNRYDNAFEAVAAVFQIGAEWGLFILTAPIIATMILGAFISGILTEYAWRTWR
jgi:hypothetical protein